MNRQGNNKNIKIDMGGGSISQSIFGGDNNRIISKSTDDSQNSKKKEDVSQAIKALVASINQHSEEISDEKELIEAVQQIEQEAFKEKPNKITVKSLLNGIKAVVEPVTEIVQKVDILKAALVALLGI